MLAVLGDVRTGFLSDRTQGIIGGIVEKYQLIFQNAITGHIHPGKSLEEMSLGSKSAIMGAEEGEVRLRPTVLKPPLMVTPSL